MRITNMSIKTKRMKIQDIHNLVPLEKSQLLRPLGELTQEELESIHYCDLADSQLNCIWY